VSPARGVSAYLATVTAQMVHNFLRGGAAINALAQYVGAKVIIVDVGVAADIAHADLLSRKVAFGTVNMTLEPAMPRAQMLEAIQVGIDVCDAQLGQGIDLVATGDMGIGNTTASSAITAALPQMPVALVTGRSAGINDEQLAHKIQVIEQALARHDTSAHSVDDAIQRKGREKVPR
jgi:nicotinate-nucleotide--dimethylbenzimidazole phosphoribosyltransferase